MIKKILSLSILGVVIFFLLVITFFSIIDILGEPFVLYLNWKIHLPKPQEINTIYKYDYKEGEDFLIWVYSEKKMQKIVSRKPFCRVEGKSLEKVKARISEYYNRLDDNEKKLFDDNVSFQELFSKENYYILKTRNNQHNGVKLKDDFILIIANTAQNKLYYFNAIW